MWTSGRIVSGLAAAFAAVVVFAACGDAAGGRRSAGWTVMDVVDVAHLGPPRYYSPGPHVDGWLRGRSQSASGCVVDADVLTDASAVADARARGVALVTDRAGRVGLVVLPIDDNASCDLGRLRSALRALN